MRKIIVATLLAGGAVASPALAQDVGPTFTGPRVEAILGYDHVGAGSDVDNDNGRNDQSIDGLLYGVGAGYDVNLGSAVVGVEGEFTNSTAKSSRYDFTDDFGFGRVKQGRDLYIGARAGILADPATLVYVKGGYTNSKLKVLAGDTDETTNTAFKLDGWRIGAGVERAINTNTFAKVEYRYSNYNKGRIRFDDGATSRNFDVDTDRHQVVASVGYRF
ncbi:outer membrane immunogenic protein [Sphingobium wenxiniae]|uniref:Membrane protein n=2 Tax=Sphingobium TaxID=165695 RepID=T0I9M2_9SPHN|nr:MULTISPECIES: outer membrane beta-barrel protein [Sphingobium]EQB06289.1 membrane protein [Sphingobium baderi LL03]KMS62432.1 membrane protein [Sphingobium baderi LL03]MBB6190762.1 outer membrane immunogenic protein [Sphingobium wenxiniae]TWH94540.1 outer membrane immunogenic protein [Sphingobium wenxiniae]WRD76803.1 outer membrane beta-barrel protein [Sphingobium baderi]